MNSFLLYEDNITYDEVDDVIIPNNVFTTTLLDGIFQYCYDYGSSQINYSNPVRKISGLNRTDTTAGISEIRLDVNNITVTILFNIH